MKNTKYSFTRNLNPQPRSGPQVSPGPQVSKCRPHPVAPPGIRTTARDYANPVDYKHPYPSMGQLADLLALRYDANRTRHAYYRQLRLLHQHFNCDPSTITESQLRDYFLLVKLKKHWQPKTIRQAVAGQADRPGVFAPAGDGPGAGPGGPGGAEHGPAHPRQPAGVRHRLLPAPDPAEPGVAADRRPDALPPLGNAVDGRAGR